MAKPDTPTAFFDADFYQEINVARWAAAQLILDALPPHANCLDVGCGPGWFAQRLAERGLHVVACDGRAELAEVATQRAPDARVVVANVESAADMAALPRSDLVFCFGLLYHLENPFAAIRNLRSVTGRTLLIESVVTPGAEPNVRLIAEGQNATQGLNHHALIPTRVALVKMLSVAGFASIERYRGEVAHDDFREGPGLLRRREIFLCGDAPSGGGLFETMAVPFTPKVNYRV